MILKIIPFQLVQCIVNIWNSFSASVISANNVNMFKNRLDRFWANKELIYDYKSALSGTKFC